MELSGTIKKIDEIKTFGNNGFRKREMVLTTEDQYPQQILIEFIQDKCDVLNSFSIGDKVTIGINIRGREWVNPEGVAKYFNSIQGWKIDKTNSGASNTIEPMGAVEADNISDEEPDDLPF